MNGNTTRSQEDFKIGLLTTMFAPLLPTLLQELIEKECNDILIICDAKLPSEKDKKIWLERTGGEAELTMEPATYIERISKYMMPFYFVESHNNHQTIDIIKNNRIKVLLNAGTPRRLNNSILSSTEYGVLNIHPGILPEYRGCTCVEWAIHNDEKVGNTAHFMNEGYDLGPILRSEYYEFPKKASYQYIRKKVYIEGCKLASKILLEMQNRTILPTDGRKQRPEDGKYWQPIPDSLMNEVYQKLQMSRYRYQVL